MARNINEHGFEILAEIKGNVEAVARIARDLKFDYKRANFAIERKYTPHWGGQLLFVVWLPKGRFPKLLKPNYIINYGRIEIPLSARQGVAVIQDCARNLGLIR